MPYLTATERQCEYRGGTTLGSIQMNKLTNFVDNPESSSKRAAVQKITMAFLPLPGIETGKNGFHLFHALEGLDLEKLVRLVDIFIPHPDDDEACDVPLVALHIQKDMDLAILYSPTATFHRLLIRENSKGFYARSYTVELHNVRSLTLHEGRILPNADQSNGYSSTPGKVGFSGGPMLDRRGFVDGLLTRARPEKTINRVAYPRCEKIWDYLCLLTPGLTEEEICRRWQMKGKVTFGKRQAFAALLEGDKRSKPINARPDLAYLSKLETLNGP